MQDDGMDEATIEQILKGEVQEFLCEFEASEEREERKARFCKGERMEERAADLLS